jgi:hypothetical protein
MQRVAHSILSGRILLHLRQAASIRIINSRMEPMTEPSAVSIDWKVKTRARENRTFIETIREEFQEDVDNWFGTEVISSTESNTSMSISTTETQSYLARNRNREEDKMVGTPCYAISANGQNADDEDSHLEVDS